MNKTELKARIESYKKRLDLYLNAEEIILTGAQSYKIGSRDLTRADISEIRKVIKDLTQKIDELESELAGRGRRRCLRGLPRDI